MRQCRKPTGPVGWLIVRMMNRSHAELTTWGLQHVNINGSDSVLDVGCGGGMTVHRLAKMVDTGSVCGVDYAEASVASSTSLNKAAIDSGHVSIQKASVSRLPFPDGSFDLVTAIETHYYWPDHDRDLQEISRVLKPGGCLLIVAESYRDRRFGLPHELAMKSIDGAFLSPDNHNALLTKNGFWEVRLFVDHARSWMCVVGRKPR